MALSLPNAAAPRAANTGSTQAHNTPQLTASRHAAASSAVRAISRAARKFRNIKGEKTLELPKVGGFSGSALELRVRPPDLTVTSPAGWRTFANTPQTVSALDAHFGVGAEGRATRVAFSSAGEKPWVEFTTRLDHADDVAEYGDGRAVSQRFFEDGHHSKMTAEGGKVLTHFERYDSAGKFIAGSVRTNESGEMFSFWPAFGDEPDRLIVRANSSPLDHLFEGEHARFIRSLINETETMDWDSAGRFHGGYFIGDSDTKFTIHPEGKLVVERASFQLEEVAGRQVSSYTPEGDLARLEFEPAPFLKDGRLLNGLTGPKGFFSNFDPQAQGIRITHQLDPDVDFLIKPRPGDDINARRLGLALRRADNVTIETGLVDEHGVPRISITKDGKVTTFEAEPAL